jgi:hypothetical protein
MQQRHYSGYYTLNTHPYHQHLEFLPLGRVEEGHAEGVEVLRGVRDRGGGGLGEIAAAKQCKLDSVWWQDYSVGKVCMIPGRCCSTLGET